MRTKFSGILTLILAFVVQLTFAQEQTISGTVTDDAGLPLPGVNVLIEGTSTGTQTDFDGNYTIEASEGETIVFSYVGFTPQSFVVGETQDFNIQLASGNELDEIVVVAYGVQKKEAITGSVGEIKAEEVEKITTGNVLQGTVGKVAGVQVFNGSGLPGDGPTIRIRGIGSLNASSAPLYVVDGVPFNGDIASINSQDIASMTFLKDAAAAALYGNRGANGVVIITTKKGKQGKSTITFDSKAGFATRAVEDYDLIDSPRGFYEAYYQRLKNNFQFNNGQSASAAGVSAANALIDGSLGLNYNIYNVPNNQLIDPTTGSLNPNASLLYQPEDWEDYLFTDGFFTQTNFSVSGATEKTNHYFSVGYEKNEGYVVNSGLEKISTRLKLDTEVTEKITSGMNMSYTHFKQDYLDGYTGTSAYSNPFFWTRSIAPIYGVRLYDNDGNPVFGPNGNHLFDDGTGNGGQLGVPVRPFGALQHPYATAVNDIKEYTTDNLFVSGFAAVELFEGLNFKYTATGELFNQSDRSMDTPLYGDAANPDVNGRVDYVNSRRFSLTQQQLLTYDKSFGDHDFNLLLGHETLNRRTNYVSASRSDLLLPNSGIIDQAGLIQGNSGYQVNYDLEGFFSRLTYDFDDKYFVNASIRRDGSSRFHPDNRWGTFYGLGGAWRISQESFMEDISWLNELKLKASYGEQGNDNLGIELPYLTQYSVASTIDAAQPLSFSLSYIGNPDITWETNKNANFGLNASLFNNRLDIEAEYFQRVVEDMLFNRPLPTSSGFASLPENIGDMENKGVEVSINAEIIRTKDFSLSANLNATHYKNEITRLPANDLPNNRIVTGAYAYEEGGSAYDYYLREFAGVNPNTGASLFYMDDPNNEGQRIVTENFSEATLYKLDKTALPDVYGGFGLSARYKGFDAGIQFAYQYGGYSYDNVWMGTMAPSRGENYNSDVANTWTPENPTATLPRADVEDPNLYYGTSTLGLIESDYLSIQNVSLGYTFNNKITEQLNLSSLRVYGLADNVGLWSRRQGFDPRNSGVTGNSSNNYSIIRNVSFGVNVKF
ncbi:MAG: TonB-dependent receptor [Mesonia sp.]|uniref:SusC/RagA family TonB-linked outer membrane protein n=1 Tax=Mesonia sp. TaxID=1960830 RepID=UPI00324264FB